MLGAALGAVQGLVGIAGGIIGSGKRKREQREAQAEFKRRQAQFQNLDTSNVYANMENVYEVLTVNQQQAQFEAERFARCPGSFQKLLINLNSKFFDSWLTLLLNPV